MTPSMFVEAGQSVRREMPGDPAGRVAHAVHRRDHRQVVACSDPAVPPPIAEEGSTAGGRDERRRHAAGVAARDFAHLQVVACGPSSRLRSAWLAWPMRQPYRRIVSPGARSRSAILCPAGTCSTVTKHPPFGTRSVEPGVISCTAMAIGSAGCSWMIRSRASGNVLALAPAKGIGGIGNGIIFNCH